jgi:TolA-binding protein
MSKILLGVVGAMAATGYAYYFLSVAPLKVQNQELKDMNTAQQLTINTQKDTINSIQNSLEVAQESLTTLSTQNQQYESQMAEYLDIFRRHNLAQLASAKPGLITKKANARTQEVFDAIEADTQRISNLNN